jgi:deazaflavin-dependent oxidoreductase (nitroreductase family)
MNTHADTQALADDDFCYLTTTGRVSGRPHTIEIWFGLAGATLYLLSEHGGRADWVKNLRHTPDVSIRIRDQIIRGSARIVPPESEEGAHARALLGGKYHPHRYQADLTNYWRTAPPVAVDLDVA